MIRIRTGLRGALAMALMLAAGAAVAQAPRSAAPLGAAPLAPPALLAPDAPREAIGAWLAQNLPASRGRQVYINGGEAFWIEHEDADSKNGMLITATIESENIADSELTWRSAYQVTQFDCEKQQQYHIYLTHYVGNGLTGDVTKDAPLIKRSEFVPPTAMDFAHVRAVCLPAYDRIRKRTYTVTVPAG